MKKTLLFTFLFASVAANAQMTSANEPALGETSTMFLCDSLSPNLDAIAGSAVTWDYTGLVGYQGEVRVVDVVAPASTPFAASYSTSTKAFQVENALTTYFTSSAGDRTSQGFQFYEVSFGDVLATYTTDEQTMVTYPFALGNSVVDSYEGDVAYTYNGFPVSEALVGNAYAWIDGSGTLDLPNGVSLSNVIRYKSIDTAATTVPLLGAAELMRTQYEYYDYADQNLPVFIHTTISLALPGGGTPLASITMVLSKYEANYVGINDITEFTFSVYPNPATDLVSVKGNFSAEATGSIIDQSGRVLRTMNVQNGQSIDISDLAVGSYFFAIEDNGFVTTKTIVKQ
ncbi:MAG: T9SS type A sorting domain-containing protein [Crocinitomicaceae bacterium]|nr:T9SS type A sorting domain-containing protein [Crocinitomicaceae bacterium]